MRSFASTFTLIFLVLHSLISFGHWQDELLAVWDARDQDNKFCIVCIVHNQMDADWQQHITPWAMRNAIRILPISEQCVSILAFYIIYLIVSYSVAKAFRKHYNDLSDSLDLKLRTADYDLIPSMFTYKFWTFLS